MTFSMLLYPSGFLLGQADNYTVFLYQAGFWKKTEEQAWRLLQAGLLQNFEAFHALFSCQTCGEPPANCHPPWQDTCWNRHLDSAGGGEVWFPDRPKI